MPDSLSHDVLAYVLAEIRRQEKRLDDLARQREESERAILTLRQLAARLAPDQFPESTTPTSEFDADYLARKATEFFATVAEGKPKRALDVARFVLPHYDPMSDARNFENRMYAIMNRRRDVFAKAAPGLWVLRAQQSEFDFGADPNEDGHQGEAA
jgi:hypothetical protein